MTFDELIQSARVGDLLFFSGERWWSRLIRLRTASKWSHVGIITRVVESKRPGGHLVVVTEALEGKGVRTIPADCWGFWRGTVAVGQVNLPESARQAAASYAKQQQGCAYASPRQFARSFSFVWSRLSRWAGVQVDEDERRWFCSELATAALRSTGLVSTPKAPARMTPGDVAELPCVNMREGVSVPCVG